MLSTLLDTVERIVLIITLIILTGLASLYLLKPLYCDHIAEPVKQDMACIGSVSNTQEGGGYYG